MRRAQRCSDPAIVAPTPRRPSLGLRRELPEGSFRPGRESYWGAVRRPRQGMIIHVPVQRDPGDRPVEGSKTRPASPGGTAHRGEILPVLADGVWRQGAGRPAVGRAEPAPAPSSGTRMRRITGVSRTSTSRNLPAGSTAIASPARTVWVLPLREWPIPCLPRHRRWCGRRELRQGR